MLTFMVNESMLVRENRHIFYIINKNETKRKNQ
jgi:hypothetical protein